MPIRYLIGLSFYIFKIYLVRRVYDDFFIVPHVVLMYFFHTGFDLINACVLSCISAVYLVS